MFYTLFNLETEPNLQHVGTVYQKVLAFQQFSLQIQIGSRLKPSSTYFDMYSQTNKDKKANFKSVTDTADLK
jgi:hypothetical protein